MKLVTREQWNARAPKTITKLNVVNSITEHWEGPHMGDFSHDKCAALVKGIQNYHMDHNGWADIAYNAVICYHGYTFEGRWLGVRSAANGTNPGNDSSYAICAMRGDKDPFTDAMKEAFVETADFFRAHGAGATVFPHKHWFNTTCPGPDQEAWIAAGCPVSAASMAIPAPARDTTQAIRLTLFEDGSYWVFASDGGVFAYNGAPFFGSLGSVRLNAPIVSVIPLLDRSGYTLIGADGGIFAFGSARSIPPYQGLFAEYASGQRRIVDAQPTKAGLCLLSNLGERYFLG